MNDPHIILPAARLVSEPEIKQSKNGTPYCLIRVAANGAHKDKTTQQWIDHDTMFATIFEYDQRLAATYMQALHKGTPVRVEGDLKWATGTDRNGQPRTDFIIDYATISMVIQKAKASQQPQPQRTQPQSTDYALPQQQPAYDDPYANVW